MYNFGANSNVWVDFEDHVSFSFMRFFFETKSWRLFSFLFGLRISHQLLKSETQKSKFFIIYIRRMVILFLIGALHALFYDGDILMLYAMLGLVLILFSRMPLKMILLLAIMLLSIFPVGTTIKSLVADNSYLESVQKQNIQEELKIIDEKIHTHPYSIGSVKDVMLYNSGSIPPNPTKFPLGVESHFAYLAMFLLGLFAGKKKYFQNISNIIPFVRKLCYWCISIGILSMIVERAFAYSWDYNVWGERGVNIFLEFVADTLFAYGSTALSIGYATLIIIFAHHTKLRILVQPLGKLGRMALTVYLTQTLIFTTIFYGYGLGQVYKMGPFEVTFYAVVIFSFQIVVCSWWLKHYRFGPMEWLWRGLTYLKFPSMKMQERLN